MNDSTYDQLDGVAVVGMACRFPGAPDLATFWSNLRSGVESIRHYTEDELREAGVDPALLRDPRYVKANAALDDCELFDAAFFGMNPRVAEITDPQQRVFLELAWQALEHAGYDAERYVGEIGVFAGLSLNTYLIQHLIHDPALLQKHGVMQVAMANRGDHLATLTAYKLNLRGPAFGVQSTCSTSLSAVHLACQTLLACQADMVIAGGVAIRVPVAQGYLYEEGGVASPDGHCRPFDAQARGTVFGSGAGAVVLKRLEDALADGDSILAVIRGSAANNDGAVKTGYTAPSVVGQARAIRLAQAVAGVSPDSIEFIECHGTGTVLGDPIEVEALRDAFSARTTRRQFCALGSVKANIGHLDTAAGIAGLIKAVLCLAHKELPPTLHFREPNPHLDLPASPFYVNAALQDWPASPEHPRRAGVSGFGIGGTNVHLVLEEAPASASQILHSTAASERWHALLLSARTASALEAQTARLAQHLAQHPELPLSAVAHTLHMGRKRFEYRRTVICCDGAEAPRLLQQLPPERVFTAEQRHGTPAIAFVLPGLGSQRAGTAGALADEVPTFGAHHAQALQALARAGVAVAGLDDASELAHTPRGEAALFAFEYALARTWSEWGVQPRALLGDGVGEYAALCLAGCLSLDAAAELVALRGRLLERLPRGAMCVVLERPAALAALLAERKLALAMVARASLCVVSGAAPAIEDLQRELARRDVTCRRLVGDRALQSFAVEPILAEFRAAITTLPFAAPHTALLSGASGQWLDRKGTIDWPAHLAAQLRGCLDLSTGFAQLFQEPERVVLEVGPGRMLMNAARLSEAKAPGQLVLASLAMRDPAASPAQALATARGRLWVRGAELTAGEAQRRVALPSYPFERQRLWLARPTVATQAPQAELPQRPLDEWFYVPSWRRSAPLPRPRAQAGVTLLFRDTGRLGTLLAAQLRDAGQQVIVVDAGNRFDATPGAGYAVDPERSEDYRALLRELNESGRCPSRIVHLWTVDALPQGGARLERAERNGWSSLLALAQAIGETLPKAELALDVVSSELHAVLGNEALCAEKATLLGPVLAMASEYPGLRCRAIDVVVPQPGSGEERALITQLQQELASPAADSCVAYRGPHRWLRAFERAQIEPSELRLRDGAAYLITGGLGGMGLTLAKKLAQSAPIQLVLLGRQPPSEHARAAIAALERLGSTVLAVCADVSDSARMREVLADVHGRVGPIHGLIHAAGVPAGGMMQRKTPAIAQRVLAAKTRGTLVLHELLAHEPLDFAVYCGSRTALLGGFGQSDYTAANAFLDAFAHQQSRAARPPVMTIDWCGWRDVGMLAQAARGTLAVAATPTAPAALPPPPRELGHPLLQRQISATVYESVLSLETHWLLTDHRIAGNPALSGTSYLEMVRAALEQRREGRPLELSDIYFWQPLVARAGERRTARLVLTEQGAGFAFEVSSTGTVASASTVHVTGKARFLPSERVGAHDLAALLARCSAREQGLTDDDAVDDDHGPRWQCVRKLQWGDGELLAWLELPPECLSDLEQMKLHPSLLDKSIGTGHEFIPTDVPYMPYSYKRLIYRAPFTQRICVHARSKSAESCRSETPAFNIVIMDGSGRELVRIDEFALKRVNDVGAVYRNLAERAQPSEHKAQAVASPASVFSRIMEQEGIGADQGAEVFGRLLGALLAGAAPPQVIVAPRDMTQLLKQGVLAATATALPDTAAVALAAADSDEHELRPRPRLATEFVAPRGELQQRLAAILRRALGVEQIGARDNFFELGGDSLVAIQIVAQLRQLTGRDVEPIQLFEAPTVEALAEALGGSPLSAAAAPSAGDAAAMPASSAHEARPEPSRGAARRARQLARRNSAAE